MGDTNLLDYSIMDLPAEIREKLAELDLELSEDDFSNMLGRTRPKVIFCESNNIDVVRQSLDGINHTAKLFTFDKKTKDAAEHVENLFKPTKTGGNDLSFTSPEIQDPDNYIAVIVGSSGTTGSPKGIAITHKAFITQLEFLKQAKSETYYQPGPIYWQSAILGLFDSAVRGVTRIISSDPFDPKKVIKIVRKYKVNFLVLPPDYLESILPLVRKNDFSKLQFIFTTGGPLSERLRQQIETVLTKTKLGNFYGMTETISSISYEFFDAGDPNTIGSLFPGVQAKIIDEHGNALDNLKRGEILVNKSNLFHSYIGQPEKTRESFDENGWLYTGDIGYFDATGKLFVVDRKKDMISRNGFWILPGPLEEKISNLDGIEEVAVVGIPYDNTDELPAAVVVRTEDSTITEEDIHQVLAEFTTETLEGGVYFVESLPKTQNGKVKKMEVKQMAIELADISRHL